MKLNLGLLFVGIFVLAITLFVSRHSILTRHTSETILVLELNDLIASLERQNEELDHIIGAVEAGSISIDNPIIEKAMNLQDKRIFELLGTKTTPIKKFIPSMLKNDFKMKARLNNLDNLDNNNNIITPTTPPTPKVEEKVIKLPPNPITFNSNINNGNKAILIVGGTDGSGTRKVVDILRQMGVLMVSEDPETYDIHADSVFGWPTIVNPILESTKSLNYEMSTLPQTIQQKIKNQLNILIDKANEDSHKPTSFKLAVGGALPRPINSDASQILYGFKAPVSMTLAPLWADILPSFRFLHVLRDGRDIAFSANQGPVEKFYHIMYGKDIKNNEQKAISLWSDWNTQIHLWAKNYATKVLQSDKSFGYFALHSEDLVNSSLPVKFAAITHLAEWVGSTLTEDQLCCLALQEGVFMGSHDRTQGKGSPKKQLESRYGKWKVQLKGNDALSRQMHEMGKSGLSTFGYEPLRELAKEDSTTITGYVCKIDNPICVKEKEVADSQESYQYSNDGNCRVKMGVDFKGSDMLTTDLTDQAKNKGACCQLCISTPGCTNWTFNKGDFNCYLKSSEGIEITDRLHLVSGSI